jgi:ankyrin repeat protein
MFGARTGHMKLVKLMHRHDADLEFVNSKGENAYMIACKYGNFEIADFLLFLGVPQDSKNETGANVMHIAAKGKNWELMK